MLFFSLWIISLILCLLSSIFQKFERLIGLFTLIIFGIIEGNPNYLYGDASVYYNDYFFKTQQFEKGYNYLTNFFGSYVDYQSFRLITSIFFMILLCVLLLLITEKISLFALFYGIGAFPNDVQQVRNQMAAVFIVGAVVLLYKFNRKGIIPAILTIYVGSLFHSIALLYLLFPIIFFFKDLNKGFKKISVLGLFIAIIVELANNVLELNNLVSNMLTRFSSRSSASTNVMDIYSNNLIPFSIWLLTFITTLIMICLVFLINYKNNISVDDSKVEVIQKMAIGSLYIWMIGLILLASSIEYIRILRISSVILFITIGKTIELKKENLVLKNRLIVIGLLYSIILLILQAWIYYTNIENWFKALNFIQ